MKFADFKKLVAMAMATVMLVSSPVMTLATESSDGDTSSSGTINGTGSVEEYIDKDVFKVVLPTVSNVDFTLDPQGLLKIADNTNYTLDAGAVYFANAQNGGTTTYSNTSDAIEIVNKSSYDIDVEFSIKVTMPDGVELVDSQDKLTDATKPSVYLAMKEADGEAKALASGENKYAVTKVTGVAEDQTGGTGYMVKTTGTAPNFTYEYVLGDSFDVATADKASYTLTGACDSTADWTDVKSTNVTAEVVWSAEKHAEAPAEAAPSIEATEVTLVAGTDTEITVNLGAGDLEATGISKITYINSSGATKDLVTSYYKLEGNKLTIYKSYTDALTASRDITIVFNDDAGTTDTVTLKK